MEFKVVIPARYGSTRLPGKPLLAIQGKPMLQHTHERAQASGASQVVVATDDIRIARRAESFGAEVCMTSHHHQSGSDRIAEVLERLAWPAETLVVNLQGDEPCMPPTLIQQVAADLATHQGAAMATLMTPLQERENLFDPHVVKVVADAEGYALYFSRAPIPWHRDEFLAGTHRPLPPGVGFFRHIGLYAYSAAFLRRYVSWAPCPLEAAEALEQLRVLWHGERIHVSQALEVPGPSLDTPDDLPRVEAYLAAGQGP